LPLFIHKTKISGLPGRAAIHLLQKENLTMKYVLRVLLTVVVVVGVLVVCVPAASAQTCVAFSTVQHANNPGDKWVGEGWYTFGNAPPA
jgi:hypothetical protein